MKGALEASPDLLFCYYATLHWQPPCAFLVAALRNAREGDEGVRERRVSRELKVLRDNSLL